MRFTIYEDDNETYAYEKGACATYELAWDEASQTLQIGNRQGAFPGLIPTRTLNLVLMGASPDQAKRKTLVYRRASEAIAFTD